MLDFNIDASNIYILFGTYLTFFGVVFGIAKAVALFKEKA